MKNENYIGIQGWMINELKLKNNELIVYAIIHGFSQDGESEYYGSMRYISEALQVSKSTASLSIKKLIEKGLIIRTRESHYKTVDRGSKIERGSKNGTEGFENQYTRGSKTGTNKHNTNNKLIITRPEKNLATVKKAYGEFDNVKLTDKEILSLRDRLGEDKCSALIQELSLYIASTGKKYKSHCATLLAWHRRKSNEARQPINKRKEITII